MMQNRVEHDHVNTNSFTQLSKQFSPLGKGVNVVSDAIVYTYSRKADGSYDEVTKYDIQGKQLFQVYNYREDLQLDIILMTETGVIDLEMSGKRWEGGLRNGVPFGWGCMYDDVNHLVYEGFANNGKYDGYGTEYYPGIGVRRYEGTWRDGRYCGQGRTYDLNGDQMMEGEFFNLLPCERDCTLSDSSFPICNRILHLVIDQYKSPLSCFDLHHLSQLRDLKVQGESFPWTHSFQAVNHPFLEHITINDNCFGFSVKDWGTPANHQTVLVSNCPRLTSLSIGDDCFSHSFSFCFCGSHIPSVSRRLSSGAVSLYWESLLSTL